MHEIQRRRDDGHQQEEVERAMSVGLGPFGDAQDRAARARIAAHFVFGRLDALERLSFIGLGAAKGARRS
jgi:hypothetical protein